MKHYTVLVSGNCALRAQREGFTAHYNNGITYIHITAPNREWARKIISDRFGHVMEIYD